MKNYTGLGLVFNLQMMEKREKLFHFDCSAGYLWWLLLDNVTSLVHQCSTETLTFYDEFKKEEKIISEISAVSSS